MPIPNFMAAAIIIHKPESRTIPIPRGSGMHLMAGVRVSALHVGVSPAPTTLRLLGCADGGVVPAVVQMALVAVAADALAAPADEEEAASC